MFEFELRDLAESKLILDSIEEFVLNYQFYIIHSMIMVYPRNQHRCAVLKMIPKKFYLVQLSSIVQHFDYRIANDIVVAPNFPQNYPNCPGDGVVVVPHRPSGVVHVGPIRAWLCLNHTAVDLHSSIETYSPLRNLWIDKNSACWRSRGAKIEGSKQYHASKEGSIWAAYLENGLRVSGYLAVRLHCNIYYEAHYNNDFIST